MKKTFNKTVIELMEGDITELDTDAIVNAANAQLAHGGGVAGAIVKKGGYEIQDESDIWIKAMGGPLSTGSVAITGSGALPCKYVIHAVGPRMGEGNEDEKLKRATLSSLRTGVDRGFKTIAFPAISTGIFGFPIDRCATIMLSTTIDFAQQDDSLEKVVFCLFSPESLKIFKKTLKQLSE